VVIALLTVHPLAAKGRSERLKGAVRDGLRYARSRQQLWLSLWMTALIGLLAFNFAVILPELARKTFHGSGGTYGLMDAAAALVFCLQRIMAPWVFVYLGTTPVGSILIGWITEVGGPRVALLVGAGSCLVAAGIASRVHTPPDPDAVLTDLAK
jgi:MFS family permease